MIQLRMLLKKFNKFDLNKLKMHPTQREMFGLKNENEEYIMKYPRKFETIDNYTSRLRVFGGWIVRTYSNSYSGCSIHTLFLPDKVHDWNLEDITAAENEEN